MFASIETWNETHRGNESLRQNYAADSKNEAMELRESQESPGRWLSFLRIAGSRTQNWSHFFVLWQIIGGISAYDAFLAMKYRAELPHMELNGLGRLLLWMEGGDPALFLGVKFFGTMMVLGILANLFYSRPVLGIWVARGVAAFQVGLLMFLTLA